MTEAEKTELKRRIEVMQAFLDGKTVQYMPTGFAGAAIWRNTLYPVWDWTSNNYRIAPEKLTVYIYRFEGTGALFSSSVQQAGFTLVKIIEVEV